MADNPIKYSDFIAPDNSISDLIKQLDELSDSYTNALKNIKGEAIQLAQILEKVTSSTDAGRNATRNAAAEADKLAKAQRDLAFAESENAKVLAELKAAQNEANTINKLLIKRGEEEITMANMKTKSYNQLSAQYSLNKIVLNSMSAEERTATEAGRKFEEETRAIYEEMKRLQEVTGKHTLNVGNYGSATEKLTSIIRKNTEELARMRMAGEAGTQAYQDLLERTGELQDSIADARQEVTNMASDTTVLDQTLGALGVAGGGISVVVGGMELLGSESEDVAEAQKKLQSVIAITTGVQALQNNLQKQSAVMLGISTIQTYALAKAEAYKRLIQIQGTKATVGATIAQAAFNLVAKANPYVLLAMALITVIGALVLFARGSKEAEQEQERLNREIENTNELIEGTAKGAGAQIVSFKKLQKAWDELGNDLNKKKKFIKDNQEEFDKLGVKVTDVKDAENLLITNSEAFVQAILLKSRALAGQNLAIKEYEKALQDQMKAEQKQTEITNKQAEKPKVNFGDRVVAAFSGGGGSMTGTYGNVKALSAQEVAAGRLQGQIRDLKGEMKDFETSSKDAFASGDKYILASAEDAKKASELLKESNIIATSGKSGKGGGSDNALKKRQEELKNANKELQEEQIKAIKDDTTRQVAEVNFQTKQRVDAIKARVKDITKLSQEEKDTIALIEQNAQDRITQIQTDGAEKTKRIEADKQIALLEAQRAGINLQLSAVEEGSQAEFDLKLKLLEKERQLELAQNSKLASELQQSEAAINAKYDAQRLAQQQEFTQTRAMQMFDMEQQLQQSEFDLLKKTEGEKTRYKLQAEAARWKKILELNKTAAKKLSDEEVKIIENTIARINQEIEASSKDEKNQDIYTMFGLNLDDDAKEAISTSTQFALDQLTAFMDAKVAAADIAVEAADKEVDASQKRVDQEIEARNNGYANNVAMAQKELDMAKKNQDKALKEQAKAQKAQAAIQTLQQVGNLITATAMIWGQLGFPWAIPAIAVMWGSFAAAKIKAAQVTKAQGAGSESYGDGTVELLEGGSHQSGNDVDLGTKRDGTRRRAEGGEFFAVINKRNSRKYRKLIPEVIRSLNRGTFENKYLGAYETGGLSINVAQESPDLKDIKEDVKQIKTQNERRYIQMSDGSTLMIYKNLRRKIKN